MTAIDSQADNFDCIVIGGGAGGAAAAWRLCQSGLKVLMLEAGPRFDPATDYSLAESDWELKSFPEKEGSQGAFTLGDLGPVPDKDTDFRSWSAAMGPYVSGDRRRPSGAGYSHVQGVGGSTLHFVGEAHRMHPKAMTLRSDYGVGADWPISYADLEPYYCLAEQVIGVAGADTTTTRWRSKPYPLPPHPMSTPAQRLIKAGAGLGMTWEVNPRAALSEPYDDRPACNYCGNCSRGCPIGDKGSADVTFIRKAEDTGRLTIQTLAQVTKIHIGKSGKVDQISYIDAARNTATVGASIFVLAAGAVQTPRLLLASADANAPDGVANGSRQVGRNFMETLHWGATGILDDLTDSYKGLPSDTICWDFNAPDAVDGVVGGFRMSSSVRELGFVGPSAYATRAIDAFGHNLKQRMRQQFGKAITVSAIGEVLPNDHSFVDLHPSRKDAYDMPLARIQSIMTPDAFDRLGVMAQTSRAVLTAAGVNRLVEVFSSADMFSTTHAFGTCRLGHDSQNSVVDSNGRSHDHDNLYIADASLFPSSGGGESPALTIFALGIRIADAIAGKEFLTSA